MHSDEQTKRTDGDTWDIVTSVGMTALGVATFRAIETVRRDALIEDRYAAWFVEAAGEPRFVELLRDPKPMEGFPFARFMGLRTKFFDEYFVSASATGIRQAVILAAGLDARAYRLPWPSGTTVFEIDLPKVLDFKDHVLTRHSAEPKATRRAVAVDLRGDWPSALTSAGFDPDAPSAWTAEGLLTYLPGQAHDSMLERIDHLSSSGSQLALNGMPSGVDPSTFEAMREKYIGENPFGSLDVTQLFYTDDRVNPEEWLAQHDWEVREFTSEELAEKYEWPTPDLPDDLANLGRERTFTTAIRK